MVFEARLRYDIPKRMDSNPAYANLNRTIHNAMCGDEEQACSQSAAHASLCQLWPSASGLTQGQIRNSPTD
nr:hypothetical protein CFP56_09089 [Quercus suber]